MSKVTKEHARIPDRKISKILLDAFLRKLESKPGYSRNALARDLEVSGAFVTNLLNGKKIVPMNRLRDLFRFLELDIMERQNLVRLAIVDLIGAEAARYFVKPHGQELTMNRSMNIPRDSLLSNWWNIAVLEGISLQENKISEETLGRRLGLSHSQVKKSIDLLKDLDLVDVDESGQSRKKNSHIYLSSGRSRLEIRNHHTKMISMAIDEMQKKTADDDFHRRLITGFTLAVASERIEEAKIDIQLFLDSLSRKLSAGTCDQIYQINVQLFPLSKRIS
jgi:uncharacterized protein (TIGR02147 family)